MSFVLKLSVFSIAVTAILYSYNVLVPTNAQVNNAFIIPLYFFVLTAVLHTRLVGISKNEPKRFVNAFIGSTALRMLLTLLALIAYIVIDKPGAMNFAIALLLSYFIYVVFEVVELQKFFRK
jgi:hypothetical protein